MCDRYSVDPPFWLKPSFSAIVHFTISSFHWLFMSPCSNSVEPMALLFMSRYEGTSGWTRSNFRADERGAVPIAGGFSRAQMVLGDNISFLPFYHVSLWFHTSFHVLDNFSLDRKILYIPLLN